MSAHNLSVREILEVNEAEQIAILKVLEKSEELQEVHDYDNFGFTAKQI